MERVTKPIRYDELRPGKRFIRLNTQSVSNEDGSYNILLHGNLIAILYFDGSIQIYSGGWKSKTTKQRLNLLINHTGLYLFSFQRTWLFQMRGSSTFFPPFEEGTLIGADGSITIYQIDKQTNKIVRHRWD